MLVERPVWVLQIVELGIGLHVAALPGGGMLPGWVGGSSRTVMIAIQPPLPLTKLSKIKSGALIKAPLSLKQERY